MSDYILDYAADNNIEIPAEIVDDLINIDNLNNAVDKLIKKYREIEALGGDIPYQDAEAWVCDIFRCTIGDKVLAEHPYMKGYDSWSQAKKMICDAAGVSTGAWRTHECKKEDIPAKWFKSFISAQVLEKSDRRASAFGYAAITNLLTRIDTLETEQRRLRDEVNGLKVEVRSLRDKVEPATEFKF